MLTEREERVVQQLRQRRIETMANLCRTLDVSHMTVVRALGKVGYFSSYNRNAGYYVLADVPHFDRWGLWSYRDVRFSRHGSLLRTIVALVEQADAGFTSNELGETLGTSVANLLGRLVRAGRLGRQPLQGRRVVYLASDASARQRQWQQRLEQGVCEPPGAGDLLPEGCSPGLVIDVLRAMVVTPKATASHRARKLRERGRQASAGQVQRILVFYHLEKKRRRSSG